jgi:hypothetical protein
MLYIKQNALAGFVQPFAKLPHVAISPVRELWATGQSGLKERPQIGWKAKFKAFFHNRDLRVTEAWVNDTRRTETQRSAQSGIGHSKEIRNGCHPLSIVLSPA